MLFSKKEKVALQVNGMSCAHCEQSVEKGLNGFEGIVKVNASADNNSVEIIYKGDQPDLEKVREKIVSLGYEPVA